MSSPFKFVNRINRLKIFIYFGLKTYFFYFIQSLCKNINIIIYFTLSFNIILILPLYFYYYFCPFFFFVFSPNKHNLTQIKLMANLYRHKSQPLFLHQNPHIQTTTNSSQDTTKQTTTKISKPLSKLLSKPSHSHFWQGSESWWAW